MIGQKAIGSRYVDDRRISTVLGPNCGGVYRAPSWSSLTETKGRHVQQSLNNCSRDGRPATVQRRRGVLGRTHSPLKSRRIKRPVAFGRQTAKGTAEVTILTTRGLLVLSSRHARRLWP